MIPPEQAGGPIGPVGLAAQSGSGLAQAGLFASMRKRSAYATKGPVPLDLAVEGQQLIVVTLRRELRDGPVRWSHAPGRVAGAGMMASSESQRQIVVPEISATTPRVTTSLAISATCRRGSGDAQARGQLASQRLHSNYDLRGK